MQTAQQHARGSGARLALSLLTASRATPSRHAPGAVAEQEVLLDPLQRLAGIGELVAALRSLRFCSASSAFLAFFGAHLATWQPTGLAFRHEYSCILIIEKISILGMSRIP